MHKTTVARLRIVWVVLAVLSALVCLATYGMTLPPTFVSSLNLDGVVAADSNGSRTVIADASARRLLILNENDRLTTIINYERLDSPIDVITDVCASQDGIYVAGMRYVTDSDMINSERVLSYDFDGGYRGIVYETAEKNHFVLLITSLCDDTTGVIVAFADQDLHEGAQNSLVNFLHVGDGKVRKIRTVVTSSALFLDAGGKLYGNDEFAALDYLGVPRGRSGALYEGEQLFTALGMDDEGTVFVTDDATDSVVTIADGEQERVVLANAGRQSLHINHEHLTTSSHDRNCVTIMNLSTDEVRTMTEVTPASRLALLKGVVWFCRAFLGLSALACLVLSAVRSYRAGTLDHVGPLLAALAVLITVGLAIYHLSSSSYKSLLNIRAREVSAYADYLLSESYDLGDMLGAITDRTQLRSSEDDQAATKALDKAYGAITRLESLVNAAGENGINLYFVLYCRDAKGVYHFYDSALENIAGTSVRKTIANTSILTTFGRTPNTFTNELRTGTTLRDTTQYCLVPLYSREDNSVVAVLEIGSKQKSYAVSILGDLTSNVLGLLVMTLVVYLTYAELRACGRCYLTHQHLREEHTHDAEAMLTRPFSFFVTILTSIDSVMTVLIARSLVSATGLDLQGFYVAIPSVMLGLGLAIGQLVYGLVSTRLSLRKILRRGSLAMCACAVLAALVVGIKNFWLYCLAKMLMAIAFGLLYTTCYSMPRRARTESVRLEAAGGIRRTDTSAAALGTVLGGYAAQTFGSAWVYVLVAVATIPVFVMASTLLYRGRHAPEEPSDERVAGARGGVRFLSLKPTAALALLMILPVQIANGYGSFVFPLFSSDLGIELSGISNFVVLGQLAVYISIGLIERIQSRVGAWHIAWQALGLLGVVFMLFSLNTTFVWAVVVVALVGIFSKASDAWKGLWLRSADAAGVSAGTATGMMFATRSLALVIQPLLLTGLTSSLGDSNVLVIGSICLVSTLLFVYLTHDSSIAD